MPIRVAQSTRLATKTTMEEMRNGPSTGASPKKATARHPGSTSYFHPTNENQQ